jgi:predicted 3-demethylubiquinone-9 3-methyltransferase (glyoxalase superfamily)
MAKITPFLWFDNQAEEAAKFYTSIFKNSKILNVSRYTEAGKEIHGREPGSAMVVDFTLEGQNFQALNGGPQFKFSEAISFTINCKDQKEVDYYWSKLTSDGGEESMCGWLRDKFGLSWQVTPTIMSEFFSSGDKEKAGRAMNAMMKMKKLDIALLKKAYDGK